MKIGLVTACYKPVINGVTRMVTLLARELTATGHQVTIYTLGRPDPAGDAPNVVRSAALPLGASGYYLAGALERPVQRRLAEMEILHCHHLFMSLEFAARYGRAPIVYTNHTRYDIYLSTVTHLPQWLANKVMRQLWPRLARQADVVVAPSTGIRQIMRDFGVTTPIEVIENGIDLHPFWAARQAARERQASGQIVAIYVGRLSAEKEVGLLLQQFAAARCRLPNIELVVVGDGPQRAFLQALTRKLAVDGAVTFTGGVPYEEIPSYLAQADIFISASVSEVHPLTLLEARAAGLPVVARDSPGIAEIIASGENGLLVTEAADLAAGLVKLGEDRALRQWLGTRATQGLERYDGRGNVAQTIQLYERLIEAQ